MGAEHDPADGRVHLDGPTPVWERVLTVAPLVVVGTVDPDGRPDLAPKHMVMPLGDQHVAFACSPTHATHANLARTGSFTMSWVRPDDVLLAALAASPRDEVGAKPALAAIPTRPASEVEGIVLDGAHLALECRVDRVLDDWGHWSLVVGEVVHAEAAAEAVVASDEDPQDVLARAPLLAFLAPDRLAEVALSQGFPYPAGFRR